MVINNPETHTFSAFSTFFQAHTLLKTQFIIVFYFHIELSFTGFSGRNDSKYAVLAIYFIATELEIYCLPTNVSYNGYIFLPKLDFVYLIPEILGILSIHGSFLY